MNTAIQIISIQHQLLLGIENSNNLNEMLHKFLQLCNSCLALKSSHIFVFPDLDNHSVDKQVMIAADINHYLSFPRQKKGSPWSTNQELLCMANDFYQSDVGNMVIEIESGIFHAFKIERIGLLLLESNKPLTQTIQYALNPVLERLSENCTASLEHNALIQEIKNKKLAEEKFRYHASHDHITGLCNRQEIERQLQTAIKYCKKNNQTGAILLVDLVDFKNINVVMGHSIGDRVLHQLAMRLKTIHSNNCTAARFCGDEFMLLLTQLPSEEAKVSAIISETIEQIVSVIEIPFIMQEYKFSISCFIGYEKFDYRSKSIGNIIKHAELAMYEAVKKGGAKAICYDARMSKKLNQRLNYTEQIKKALANDEFELHYQPQFDYLNNMIGAEALLRWHNPVYGYQSPSEYIPITEESDLILQIGDFVLNQACKDIKMLENLTLPHTFKQVSVNISAKQLAKNNFAETVIATIERYQIQPSRLKLEITETILMDDIQHSIAHLTQLRHYGVECAIDDFGTGYSSLVYLKRMPASLLKIDRAFVINIDKDENNLAIANMIIDLARTLNMDVIAEGVENQQELDCLINLGCYSYQGYYFSHALELDKLIEQMFPSQLQVQNQITGKPAN